MGGGPSFFGIPSRKVDEPSMESFEQGIDRAFGWMPRWHKTDEGLRFGVPSRGTVRDMATQQDPTPKDIENRMAEEHAKNEAEKAAAGDKTTKEYDTPTPYEDPEEKVGTGPPELLRSHTPRAEVREREETGQPGIVRMPDGRVIVTTDPEGVMASEGGTLDPEGARANVVSGPAGTVFSSPEGMLIGPGGADMSQVNLPTDEDRSPGWATRKAYNELYAAGELSMDPRDIMDRRRWEEQEEARESDIELARARRDAAIMQASIDPYRMAQIEAEGKYGGTVLKQEAQTQRIMAALQYYAVLGSQISELERQLAEVDPESGQAAALKQALDRVTQERRELANIAMGFKIQDPEFNPFAAMLGAVMSPGAASGGE